MNDTRLSPHASHVINSAQQVTFSFAGRRVTACEGDTIATALYVAGIRIFSRSFKYHRPRGLLCCSGKCPNCLMNVDGTPNVRTCSEPVREGMQVRPQNAWPSVEHDALAVTDKLDRLLPVGFYYKTFIHPRFVWPLAEKAIRRVAGLGQVDHTTVPHETYDHQYQHTDVAVIGGGPAGLSAAREAARLGARVMLIDEQQSLGGHLRAQTRTYPDLNTYEGLRGFEIAQRLREEIVSLPGVEVLCPATVFGRYEGGLLGIVHGRRLIHLRAKRFIIATGGSEYPNIFHNNDLPGVMLGGGVQRLLHLYGVKPGTRALVVTSSDVGYTVANDLFVAGVDIAAVVDSRPMLADNVPALQHLKAAGVPVLASHGIQAARGRRHVDGATISVLDAQGNPVPGTQRSLTCDLISLSTGFAPASALLVQSGCRLSFDDVLGELVPHTMASTVFAAGDVSGIHSLPATLLQGQIAGIQAAESLGIPEAEREQDRRADYQRTLAEVERRYRENRGSRSVVTRVVSGNKKFVCLCEDVTEKDLCDGVAEGFNEIELLKRYSTVTMGPCQGQMCAMTSIGICARETSKSMNETGTTTPRPPLQAVSLGVLAGRNYQPVKYTPLHHKHVALGAEMMDLGGWKRPLTYSSPTTEHQAVRERVGMIDVSTLGKLEIKGKDAAQLLDKVYTHSFSSLRVGRVRYGIMCDDGGIILDDGTVSRLAEDHFFITTTTGNIDFVEQWLKSWTAGTNACVHVTNVTGGLAAMNVAGPHARAVLAKLSGQDLASSAFSYLACVRGAVAGVPALLLRIGFVGETGWEIHVAAEYGEHVWDAVMEAGKEFDLAPFGVEAQRILRLEKKHLIVGQDTDALSTPLEADLAWVVKSDKADFIGKNALESVQQRGHRQKLVGFVMRDGVAVEGGSAVAINGKPVGRVASARVSPYVGKCIGLAWVPIEVATKHVPLHIRANGTLVTADIVDAPFYDPEGKRLRA